MSISELVSIVTELQELRRMQEELEAEITGLQDQIKKYMGECETMTAGQYKITWKPVTTSRVDTTALKADHPEIAAQYTKSTTTRRFTVK